MIIENAQYYTTFNVDGNAGIRATINGQEMCIPLNTNNRHYQAILEWVAEGNTIEDAD